MVENRAELKYKYGAMGCGKSRELIMVWINYKEKNKSILIIKSKKDTKADNKIQSRDGNEVKADYLITHEDNIYDIISNHLKTHNLDCILVDEAQFLERHHIEELAEVVNTFNIDVKCYGLRADFKDQLFEGSAALFSLADTIEEMKDGICDCGAKATRNVRFVNGMPAFEGTQIAIDGKEDVTYTSMCRKCRQKLLKRRNNSWNMNTNTTTN